MGICLTILQRESGLFIHQIINSVMPYVIRKSNIQKYRHSGMENNDDYQCKGSLHIGNDITISNFSCISLRGNTRMTLRIRFVIWQILFRDKDISI